VADERRDAVSPFLDTFCARWFPRRRGNSFGEEPGKVAVAANAKQHSATPVLVV
jgi:hypothetical protein